VVSLSAWECGSYLYRPQKLEVHLYPTGFEHEAVKVARIDQGLRVEVHSHPGKANIVADALSRKANYNHLLAVCLTGEESSTHVLPNLSLFNIILAPTLRNEIIASQKNDESMGHIKRRIQEGDPKVACFCKDA
jgi:hypothetical protein